MADTILLADHEAKVKELQDQLDTTGNELAEVKEINAALQEEIEKLSAGIPAEKPKVSDSTFEVDGRKYGFKLKSIIHKGMRITPVEVMADETLRHELVHIGSGMIRPE